MQTLTLSPVKPGAIPNQIILAVDLTEAGSSQEVIQSIAEMGYVPEFRHVQFSNGIHLFAVLKDEHHQTLPEDDYLIDEWLHVREVIAPHAVHLWRGR